MDNVQNCDSYIIIPPSQTYRSHYLWFDNASNIRWKEKLPTPLCNIFA
jgi:hypothetical protein